MANVKVRITMFDYIKNMLDELPKDMAGVAVTPAASHLFEVNESGVILRTSEAELFHHNVAKFYSRPEIQTAVAFLFTRVKSPDQDD